MIVRCPNCGLIWKTSLDKILILGKEYTIDQIKNGEVKCPKCNVELEVIE